VYLKCSFFAKKCEKMGPFFGGGGIPHTVALEGDLAFGEKAESPFDFIQSTKFTFVQPTGVLGMLKRENLEILSMDRSNITIGCSKRW
jgi:hypothetical protein